MKLLSQRDPAWSGDLMGASDLTLGRWGCTTTCVSMISDYFGEYKSPKELAKDAHNYTPNGLVLWWNMSSKFKNMNFERRIRGNTASLMPGIIEALRDPKRAAILEVNNKTHWVVAYSTLMLSGKLSVADPWGGIIVKDVIREHHNITAVAYWKGIDPNSLEAEQEKPKPEPVADFIAPSKKLIKGDQKPEIYYFNGVEKFHFPNWFTFIEFGGTMSDVEVLPQDVVDKLKGRRKITDIMPKK